MSRICEECAKRPVAGIAYKRRGKAKAEGGVGRKIVGKTKRRFIPNLQKIRITTEDGTHRTARLCTQCLRTLTRKGRLPRLGAVRKTVGKQHLYAGE